MWKNRYLKGIYLDAALEQIDLKKLKKDLEENPLFVNIYVITIAANENDQLDIYHSKYLIQRYYQKNPPFIVGMAKQKGNAVALVEKMMQDCLALRGDANLKAFLVGE